VKHRSNATSVRDVPLPDPADVAIVSSALNGAADVLVTGDKEILALHRIGSLEILTPRRFWDKERGQPGGSSARGGPRIHSRGVGARL
jgi:predicted nucleic acid-binding protein